MPPRLPSILGSIANGIASAADAVASAADARAGLLWPAVLLVGFLLALWFFLWLFPIKLWIQARLTNTPIRLLDLAVMRLRRIPPVRIVHPLVNANIVGLAISRRQLEVHFLAGGNVDRVVMALIAAKKAGLDLTVEQACALDLSGQDVLEAVRAQAAARVAAGATANATSTVSASAPPPVSRSDTHAHPDTTVTHSDTA